MVKFSQVTKKFGDLVALDKVSFNIKAGEFVFLIGPTGAGKSTIVKLITREYLPTSGSIKVSKHDLKDLTASQTAELRRKIGVVFQDLKILKDRTIEENVALGLKILGQEEEKVRKKVKNALELVGIEKKADYFPSQLSGGELQRACLARAIVAQPEIVIADEPTGNLDPAASWQIIKVLKEINELGKTVLVATHNFEIVNSLKTRVIELDQGKVVSDKKKGKYKTK